MISGCIELAGGSYALGGRLERTREAERRQVSAEHEAIARTRPEGAPRGARRQPKEHE